MNMINTLESQVRPAKEGLSECIIAVVGFSGYFMWDLSAVFMLVSPLAAALNAESVIFLRTILFASLIVTLVVAKVWGAFVYRFRRNILGGGVALALAPLVVAGLDIVLKSEIPFLFKVIAWIAFGVSQGAFLLYWAVYFSLISTRYTPAAIATSSCVGTFLFVGVSSIRPASLGLLAICLAMLSSLGILIYLMRGVPEQKRIEAENFTSLSSFTVKSAISVAAHGIAFGFSTTTLFSLGATATFIGCASGVVGSLLGLVWYSAGKKIDVDVSFLQRLTLPPVVIGLLLMPFGDSLWQLVCCCVVNIALSHFAVMGWIGAVTANSEFSLQPVTCSSLRRLPGWIGFFLGSIIADIVHFWMNVSSWELMLTVVGIVVAIVFAAALYGMDDSKIEKQLLELLSRRNEDALWAEEEGRSSERFESELKELIIKHELSPRETEVFYLLAKGRNAEYIGKKLVISNSTTKSHIYHIYRKVGINSQQSLIDLVENYKKKKILIKSKRST